MFFVSRGNKGVTGEWRVRRGNKGLRRKWQVKGEEKPKTRVAESATRGTQGKPSRETLGVNETAVHIG
jgi:hypothetical protein